MSAAYFYPLIFKSNIITAPGRYLTRCGETVEVNKASTKHDFGCHGAYADGTAERWHKSGRTNASRESANDIVGAA
jgi:hypothetical protein